MRRARLGLYISEYSERNKMDFPLPVYSVTNSQGFCQQYFNKVIASENRSMYKVVPRGCFAYNPSRINVGSIDWQRNEERVIVSPLYVVFQTSMEMDNQFLYYYLRSDVALTYIKNWGQGSVRDNLKFTQLSQIPINVYPIEEQQLIAQRLDVLSKLISLRQRQAEKLDELVKARFVEMFGDPVRNTKHWEKASLLALGSCKNGMSFHANESGIKLRCLGVGDFKNLSYIDDVEQLPFVSLAEKPSANCFLHDGDIVFVRSNGNKALVGRCLLVYPRDTPTIYSGFCIRYRLLTEKVDPIYALHVLKAEGIRQKMSGRGANIQNLNQKILAAIEMPIPPLPLQNAFATFVHEVDREKERIQRSAALLETLKRSLMQQYFG